MTRLGQGLAVSSDRIPALWCTLLHGMSSSHRLLQPESWCTDPSHDKATLSCWGEKQCGPYGWEAMLTYQCQHPLLT